MAHKPYSRLRRCTNCLFNAFLNGIKDKEADLLEIGFGANKHTGVEIMERSENRIRWFGLDPAWADHPERGIHHGSCGAMPFTDNTFDYVIALNSMEHWGYYDDYEGCMEEIKRVLHKEGMFYSITPMNSHGCSIFKKNRVDEVLGLYKGFSKLDFSYWKNDRDVDDNEYILEVKAIK
jgi:SAM-dependent methyltransferase